MLYLTELMGTFLLLLVGMSVGAFTTSLLYAALICMGARISLAHFNPAITIAYVFRGKLDLADGLYYIFYQVLGATLAGLTFDAFSGLPAAPPEVSFSPIALLTLMASLMGPMAVLCLVHLAVLSGESRTQFFSLAIGFTLFACVVSFGEGSMLFNPAVAIGNYIARGLLGGGFNGILSEICFILSGVLAAGIASLSFQIMSERTRTGVLATEFIGTFLVVSLLITTADSPTSTMAQAVGLGYAALTFFGAEISEAHYNPAVTLSHLLLKTIEPLEAAMYIGTQFAASIAASFLCGSFYGMPPVAEPAGIASAVGILIGAWTLCLVHLHVLDRQAGNGFFGLAIGFTLLADIVVFSANFNPAAAFGLWLAEGVIGSGFDFSLAGLITIGVLVLVPLVSAAIAAGVFSLNTQPTLLGQLSMEAIGTGFIVLALICTSTEAVESFGAASTATAVESAPAVTVVAPVARRALAAWWEVGSNDGAKSSASGLDDGLLYVAITYMAKYISQAQFNPAITLAYGFVYGEAQSSHTTDWFVVMSYMLTQIVAAIIASLGGAVLHGAPSFGPSTATPGIGFIVGVFLFSFALTLVHLTVVKAQPNNGFFGMAIGFILFAGILSFGDTETGLFNPACAIGLYLASNLVGTAGNGFVADLVNLGVLVIVPIIGSMCALAAFKVISGNFSAESRLPSLVSTFATEMIGTFLIVLSLMLSTGSVGLVYVAVTFMGAWVSGAHFNPAITYVHYLLKDVSLQQFGLYSSAQFVGALLAALVAAFEGNAFYPTVDGDATPLLILCAEMLFAFTMCIVHGDVLTASGPKDGRSGNEYFGLAMGFTYLAGFMTVSGISGGLFNPAIGLAVWVANGIGGGGFALDSVVYWLIAPLIGARLAKPIISYQKKTDLSA